jgi:hypothetical protein
MVIKNCIHACFEIQAGWQEIPGISLLFVARIVFPVCETKKGNRRQPVPF